MAVEYTSGSIHFNGLGNGTDFDTMIEQLKKIEMMQANKLAKWKEDWITRQQAFQTVRAKLSELRTICLGMNTADKFLIKSAISSNSGVASVTARSDAQTGISSRLEVGQLATTSIWSTQTGVDSKEAIINEGPGTKTFSYEYAGKVRSVSVPPGTTLASFLNLLNNDSKNPGVRGHVIQTADGYTFQLQGMGLGSKNSLKILSTDLDMFGGSTLPETSRLYKTSVQNTAAAGSMNSSGQAVDFTFNYNGKDHTISIADNASVDDFIAAVNAKSGDTGVTASLVADPLSADPANPTYNIRFSGDNAGIPVTITKNASLTGLNQEAMIPASLTYGVGIAAGDASAAGSINSSGASQVFTLKHGDKEYSWTVPAGASLDDLVALVNNDTANSGIKAAYTLNSSTNTYDLTFTSVADDTPITVEQSSGLNGFSGKPSTAPSYGGWHVQQSQDAHIRVNGWPEGSWLVKDSNTLEDIIPGLTVNIKSTGTTTVSTETDTESIKENVMKFIDAVNEFRSLINELTKYDESKSTLDPDYADSQYESQKGSVLTGNYGVQLLSSQMKQATAGMPKGFQALFTMDDRQFGDVFTSLSQIGIQTDAQGSGGTLTYGLLILNTDPNLPTLDSVLAENPEAVADFFAADNQGVSDSSNFSFVSQVSSTTNPGKFDVSYDVAADGTITNAKINGYDAKVYENGDIMLVREPPKSDNSNVATAQTDGEQNVDVDIEVLETAQDAKATFDGVLTGSEQVLNPADAGGSIDFTYEFGGVQRTIALAPGATVGDLVKQINTDKENPGVKAQLTKVDGSDPATYNFELVSKKQGYNDGKTIAIVNNQAGIGAATIQDGRDARYKINGGPEKTSSVNTITGVPGLTISLKGTGTTHIKALKFNDADGLMIHVDNLTPGSYSGQVRIKQGKINEILSLLNGPKNKPEEGMLGSKGALRILEDNYNDIIAGINEKLQREDERIIKWERLTRQRFSRLEATLNQYDNLLESLNSQIKQLNGNKSS